MSDDRDAPDGARLVLRLYIADGSPNSVMARKNLEAVLKDLSSRSVALEVVDVLRDPERSLRDAVLVTPTLVRVVPAPERRIVGNLRDAGALRAVLGEDGASGD